MAPAPQAATNYYASVTLKDTHLELHCKPANIHAESRPITNTDHALFTHWSTRHRHLAPQPDPPPDSSLSAKKSTPGSTAPPNSSTA